MVLKGIDPVLRSYSTMFNLAITSELITSTLIWKRLLTEYHMKSFYTSWKGDCNTDRRQRASIDSISDWKYVSSSVPQGSIIGPNPFLIYINDTGSEPSPETLLPLYADDAAALYEVNKTETYCNKTYPQAYISGVRTGV